MDFGEIIGNDKNKEFLRKIIKKNNIPHSYLFVGIQGIGKKLIAMEFAKMLLCENDNRPCETCKSCLTFENSNNPDFFEIDAEDRSIKIEQIRNMGQKILEKPIVSNKKVYIINDSEKMTVEAQNCLLKILEEPPQYVVIILITSNESKLLSTIKSRCIKLNFEKICDDEVEKFLLKNETVDKVDRNLVSICEGSLLKATQLKGNIDNYYDTKKFIEKLENDDLVEAMREVRQLGKEKNELFLVLEYMNIIIYNKEYFNCIKYIEEAKSRLILNNNVDMTMDNLVLKVWEDINENNRS
ncbi:MAG: DNA polymerase III subunit delta' [Clostridia bacterium]|nr:DNA polymerase III subunit delta' [Clostridia bacterium]